MIAMYKGLPGAGKTFFMVHHALKALKAGVTVYSNIPIVHKKYGSAIVTKDILSAMRMADNALICIDEANIVLPNYFWNKMPMDLLMKFAQVRKYGIDIAYTSQGWSHTVKRLRDLTNIVYECSKGSWAMTARMMDPEYYLSKVPSFYKKDYQIGVERVLPHTARKTFAAYDTLGLVEATGLVKATDIPDLQI